MINIVNEPILDIRNRLKQWRFQRLGRQIAKNDLKYLFIFLGNPRSGTTITRSLLNAHSNVLISNELNLIRFYLEGENWKTILGRMSQNANRFQQKPQWSGYNYNISVQREKNIKIVGDKKAGRSVKYWQANNELYKEIQEWSPIPIKIIHCVRNPYDTIARKVIKNKNTVSHNIIRYFELEKGASIAKAAFNKDNYHTVYLEDWIRKPKENLIELMNYLDLSYGKDYIENCLSILFTEEKKARSEITWKEEEIKKIVDLSQNLSHLHYYFKENQLPF
jgi:hypothetical protein